MWSLSKGGNSRPAKDVLAEATPEPTALAADVGPFALAALRPDDMGLATINDIWLAYRAWCAKENLAPLAYAVFIEEFDKLAAEVGMLRRQDGANVVYPGVTVTNRTA